MRIKLTNKEQTYIIIFNKNYGLEYVKFVVNQAVEQEKNIKEVIEKIEYYFDVDEVINVDNLETVWCM